MIDEKILHNIKRIAELLSVLKDEIDLLCAEIEQKKGDSNG